mmetsp:Transcript_47724/g.147733  ORF Transcript_47724/g.147733 Transcript_47724/m.147733 type:complete len:268 (-) Transcript_47724:365-1168(-)
MPQRGQQHVRAVRLRRERSWPRLSDVPRAGHLPHRGLQGRPASGCDVTGLRGQHPWFHGDGGAGHASAGADAEPALVGPLEALRGRDGVPHGPQVRLLRDPGHADLLGQPRRPCHEGVEGPEDPRRALRLVRRRAVPHEQQQPLRALRLPDAWGGHRLQLLQRQDNAPGRQVQRRGAPATNRGAHSAASDAACNEQCRAHLGAVRWRWLDWGHQVPEWLRLCRPSQLLLAVPAAAAGHGSHGRRYQACSAGAANEQPGSSSCSWGRG